MRGRDECFTDLGRARSRTNGRIIRQRTRRGKKTFNIEGTRSETRKTVFISRWFSFGNPYRAPLIRRLCGKRDWIESAGYLARNARRRDADAVAGPNGASTGLCIDSCGRRRLSRGGIESRGQGYLYFQRECRWYQPHFRPTRPPASEKMLTEPGLDD